MVKEYTPPKYRETAFNCPHCGAFAHQDWRYRIDAAEKLDGYGETSKLQNIYASICKRCNNFALWKGEKLFYPSIYIAPQPTANMPDDVKEDYKEACSIFAQSPRGAAALLRLAIQKLVIYLGESGDDLNKSIGNLVKKGLLIEIQQSLDIVRVVGNNAVHPGELNIEDNSNIALSLFKLTNLIVERMITQPEEINAIYDALPKGAKDAIAKRDSKTESE